MTYFNNRIEPTPLTATAGTNCITAITHPSKESAIEALSAYTTQTMKTRSSAAVIQNDNEIAIQSNNNAIASGSARSNLSLK